MKLIILFYIFINTSVRAVATTHCVLWTIDRKGLSAMSREEMPLCILLHHLLLKSVALSAAAAMNAIDHSDEGFHELLE